MKNKNGLFFWGIIAIILSSALIKQFDSENLKFENTALSIVYIIVFVISIVFIVKGFRGKNRK